MSLTPVLAVFMVTMVGVSQSFIVITWGSCPDIPTKPDFDLQQYLGLWFSYENFDAPFQFGASCVSANYSILPDNNIKVLNVGFRDFKIFGRVLHRSLQVAEGRARVVDPNVPGGLQVQFDGQPDMGGGDDEANYLIVDTDYTTYSLVYSCSQPISFIPLKVEFAWVLTRARAARPANLDELRRTLQMKGVNPNYFKLIDHSNC